MLGCRRNECCVDALEEDEVGDQSDQPQQRLRDEASGDPDQHRDAGNADGAGTDDRLFAWNTDRGERRVHRRRNGKAAGALLVVSRARGPPMVLHEGT